MSMNTTFSGFDAATRYADELKAAGHSVSIRMTASGAAKVLVDEVGITFERHSHSCWAVRKDGKPTSYSIGKLPRSRNDGWYLWNGQQESARGNLRQMKAKAIAALTPTPSN